MFKKILSLSAIFILATSTNAATKVEKCEIVLKTGVYNQYLEQMCEFNGNVSEKFKQTFNEHSCPTLMTYKEIRKVVGEITEATMNRFTAYGVEKYCNDNLDSYADLSIALKKGIDMFNQDLFKQKGN